MKVNALARPGVVVPVLLLTSTTMEHLSLNRFQAECELYQQGMVLREDSQFLSIQWTGVFGVDSVFHRRHVLDSLNGRLDLSPSPLSSTALTKFRKACQSTSYR